ncbi:MAG: replication-relaxation family protein [Candidatus Pacebacteria bacterium]|nr:replication-relaxation family protein [Candidatus Paceibacterota bacterium]
MRRSAAQRPFTEFSFRSIAAGMDAIRNIRTRNSRWSRDAIVGRRGAPAVVRPTERDIEIFKLLVRFRYLPSDYIHAFVGGSEKALSHRLGLLSRKPNLYLARPHQQRERADANYRRLIYEIDEGGRRVLREQGLSFLPKSYHHNFAHELMVAQIMASIELGSRKECNVRFITWPEILAHQGTPAATRDSATPATIRVSYELRGERRSDEITADARPFGIERTTDGKRSYLFFPGIEADCGTEPIDASNTDRSSVAKKLAAYLTIARDGIHRSHFGFPNFFVPFITTSEARMRSMMHVVERLTEGRGSKTLLFKTFPSFTSPQRPTPNGHMLIEPWHRVGAEPLCLTD